MSVYSSVKKIQYIKKKLSLREKKYLSKSENKRDAMEEMEKETEEARDSKTLHNRKNMRMKRTQDILFHPVQYCKEEGKNSTIYMCES